MKEALRKGEMSINEGYNQINREQWAILAKLLKLPTTKEWKESDKLKKLKTLVATVATFDETLENKGKAVDAQPGRSRKHRGRRKGPPGSCGRMHNQERHG